MNKSITLVQALRNQVFIAKIQREFKLPVTGFADAALFSLMGSVLDIKLECPTDEQLKSGQ